MPCERFIFGERLRVGDRSLGEFWISVALFRETTEERGRVVIDFLAQHFIHGNRKSAGEKNRRGCASARPGRHGGNVSGQKNKETRGSATRTGGRNKHRNRGRGGQHLIHNARHRGA